jgi:hypothetical protein
MARAAGATPQGRCASGSPRTVSNPGPGQDFHGNVVRAHREF